MTAVIASRFRPGDQVRVRKAAPAGHVRTPAYVQGKIGMVAATLGAHPNPESLAYGGNGKPAQPLYRIAFRQQDLWADAPAADLVYVDIFQHWLESPEEE